MLDEEPPIAHQICSHQAQSPTQLRVLGPECSSRPGRMSRGFVVVLCLTDVVRFEVGVVLDNVLHGHSIGH